MQKPPVVAVAVRRPIGLKIFGIALALLLLMTCVTLVSSLQVRRLGQQLDFLAEHYIALDQVMGEVRAGGLAEIILMERIFQNRPRLGIAQARAEAAQRQKEAGGCEPDAVRGANAKIREAHPEAGDAQLVLYELVKLCGEGRIARAQALIELFARLREKANGLPQERAQMHAVFENYVEQATSQEERVLAVIRLQLEQNRAALGLLFAAYITRSLVRPVHDLLNGTQARVMTVFFSDLQGFTGFAERMTPTAVVKLLNE